MNISTLIGIHITNDHEDTQSETWTFFLVVQDLIKKGFVMGIIRVLPLFAIS